MAIDKGCDYLAERILIVGRIRQCVRYVAHAGPARTMITRARRTDGGTHGLSPEGAKASGAVGLVK